MKYLQFYIIVLMQIFVSQTLFAQITVENEKFTFRVVIEQGDIFEITKSGKKGCTNKCRNVYIANKSQYE